MLRPSTTSTYCNYKGWASYWDAVIGDVVVHDVAWSYEDTLPEAGPVQGLLSFDPARVDVEAELPDTDGVIIECTTECAVPRPDADRPSRPPQASGSGTRSRRRRLSRMVRNSHRPSTFS